MRTRDGDRYAITMRALKGATVMRTSAWAQICRGSVPGAHSWASSFTRTSLEAILQIIIGC